MKQSKNFPRIGFDLDGVLIPDMNYKVFGDLNDYLNIRAEAIQPIFVPRGSYVIITGRPSSDNYKTKYWADKFLSSNPPFAVHNEKREEDSPVEYKAFVINLYGLKVFVESDRMQVEELRAMCPGTKIVWFGEFVSEALSKL